MQERLIPLAGVHNFRDFGGYETTEGRRVAMHRLYRSGNLSRLSPSALGPFAELGIRLVVDLRTESERAHQPDRLPQEGGIRLEHLPISLDPEMEGKWSKGRMIWFLLSGKMERFGHDYFVGVYRRLAETAAQPARQLFRLLVEPQHYPLVLHCAGGKDRTGFGAAMILSALGVPRETVKSDYLWTSPSTAAWIDGLTKKLRRLSLNRASTESLRAMLEARPEYFDAMLDSIQARCGSTQNYLRDHLGVTEADRRMLCSLMLEPESAPMEPAQHSPTPPP